MNRNQLKTIACLSMLIDHIGLILFPEAEVLRLIGRLAMPVFAFFIGEGCYYTKNKKAYFLRVFILGIICQAVYIVEAAITGGNGFYLNILLTFSVSIPLCYLLLYAETAKYGKELRFIAFLAIFAVAFLAERGIAVLCDTVFDINLVFDYGFTGICLPMFVLLGRDKKYKLFFFACGLLVFCGVNYQGNLPWALGAAASLLLLYLYNGKGGEKKPEILLLCFLSTTFSCCLCDRHTYIVELKSAVFTADFFSFPAK